MSALRDKHGRIVGTMDSPGRGSVMLRTCNRTASDRMTLGCEARRKIGRDEALIDGDTGDTIDSAQARRIIETLINKLDPADIGFVMGLLVDAGKMTDSEVRDVEGQMDPSPDDAMATDERFRAMFPDADRIKVDNYGVQPRRASPPPMSAAQEAAFFKRYPDAARIKW